MQARARFLGLIVVAALAPSPSARAQEALGADIGENLASGRSATDFTTRIRWRSGYLALDDTFELVLNRFSGTYAARDDFALRLQVPVSYLDPDRPGVSSEFGLGDISARVLWRMWDHPKVSGFVGVEHFFPTATDSSLGTEKFVVSPLVALFFPLHRRLVFIPVYQQLFSYAGKSERADINLLRIRPLLVAPLPRRWWLLLDPGFLWDLEDDLESDDTMTLGFQVGKRVTTKLTVALKPSIQTYGSEDFSWAVEANFSFSFQATPLWRGPIDRSPRP
jgi:hypothetical protein